jgi:hypothetical protein
VGKESDGQDHGEAITARTYLSGENPLSNSDEKRKAQDYQ